MTPLPPDDAHAKLRRGEVTVTVALRDETQQNILNAFGLKAWEVGLAPLPWWVPWGRRFRAALRLVTDILAAAVWLPGG